MKKRILKSLLWIVLLVSFFSCSDSFLSQPAKGSLSSAQLLNQAGVEQVLIGAYAALKCNNAWFGQPTNWVYGSATGAESYKGSNSGDQSDINPLTTFTTTSTNSYIAAKWTAIYDGINRSNTVLKTLTQVPSGVISATDITRITGEAKFLRAFFHLEGYKVFKNIPYIDETIDYAKNNFNVPNDADIMDKIVGDFDWGYKNMTASNVAVGRANKWSAAAFEGKCLLYQKKYTQALTIFTDVIQHGETPGGTKYALLPVFRSAFDAGNDNNSESVFAIQASVNDGSGAASANPDLVLNYPYGGNSVVTCCGFNQPSMDLANSYRTSGGLPLLNGSYNTATPNVTAALSDIAWQSGAASVAADAGPLDPRIDWIN